ncbi:MAG: PadR family transcriptional regulator [Vicinamibacteraceae bacterium]
MKTPEPRSLLPLPHLTYLVLLALARGEAHGWAIIKRIDEITAGGTKPSSGSLYLAMVRLEERGLLDEVEPPTGETDERRRYYRLTAFGERVLEAETLRLAGLVKEAARQGIVTGRAAASRVVPRKA